MVHHGQVFDGLAERGEPLNCVVPDRVPNGSTGTIPVIARLVWADCEEWWPARAVRWTDTASKLESTGAGRLRGPTRRRVRPVYVRQRRVSSSSVLPR